MFRNLNEKLSNLSDKQRKLVLYGVVGMVLVSFGYALGVGAPPEPQVVEVEKVVTKTETVTRDVVPNECLTALVSADEVIRLGAEGMGVAGDAFVASAQLDLAAMSDANEKLEKLTPKMVSAAEYYATQRDACKQKAYNG